MPELLVLTPFSRLQVVHGLSIPLGKLGFHIPRTLSRGITDENGNIASFNIGSRVSTIGLRLPTFNATSRRNSEERKRPSQDPIGLSTNPAGPSSSGNTSPGVSRANSARPMWRIGGTIIHDQDQDQRERGESLVGPQSSYGTMSNTKVAAAAAADNTDYDTDGSRVGRSRQHGIAADDVDDGRDNPTVSTQPTSSPLAFDPANRTIRFPDETHDSGLRGRKAAATAPAAGQEE